MLKKMAKPTIKDQKKNQTHLVYMYMVTTKWAVKGYCREVRFTFISGRKNMQVLLKLSHAIERGRLKGVLQAIRELSVSLGWPEFEKMVKALGKFKALAHKYKYAELRTSETFTLQELLMHVQTDALLNKHNLDFSLPAVYKVPCGPPMAAPSTPPMASSR